MWRTDTPDVFTEARDMYTDGAFFGHLEAAQALHEAGIDDLPPRMEDDELFDAIADRLEVLDAERAEAPPADGELSVYSTEPEKDTPALDVRERVSRAVKRRAANTAARPADFQLKRLQQRIRRAEDRLAGTLRPQERERLDAKLSHWQAELDNLQHVATVRFAEPLAFEHSVGPRGSDDTRLVLRSFDDEDEAIADVLADEPVDLTAHQLLTAYAALVQAADAHPQSLQYAMNALFLAELLLVFKLLAVEDVDTQKARVEAFNIEPIEALFHFTGTSAANDDATLKHMLQLEIAFNAEHYSPTYQDSLIEALFNKLPDTSSSAAADGAFDTMFAALSAKKKGVTPEEVAKCQAIPDITPAQAEAAEQLLLPTKLDASVSPRDRNTFAFRACRDTNEVWMAQLAKAQSAKDAQGILRKGVKKNPKAFELHMELFYNTKLLQLLDVYDTNPVDLEALSAEIQTRFSVAPAKALFHFAATNDMWDAANLAGMKTMLKHEVAWSAGRVTSQDMLIKTLQHRVGQLLTADEAEEYAAQPRRALAEVIADARALHAPADALRSVVVEAQANPSAEFAQVEQLQQMLNEVTRAELQTLINGAADVPALLPGLNTRLGTAMWAANRQGPMQTGKPQPASTQFTAALGLEDTLGKSAVLEQLYVTPRATAGSETLQMAQHLQQRAAEETALRRDRDARQATMEAREEELVQTAAAEAARIRDREEMVLEDTLVPGQVTRDREAMEQEDTLVSGELAPRLDEYYEYRLSKGLLDKDDEHSAQLAAAIQAKFQVNPPDVLFRYSGTRLAMSSGSKMRPCMLAREVAAAAARKWHTAQDKLVAAIAASHGECMSDVQLATGNKDAEKVLAQARAGGMSAEKLASKASKAQQHLNTSFVQLELLQAAMYAAVRADPKTQPGLRANWLWRMQRRQSVA